MGCNVSPNVRPPLAVVGLLILVLTACQGQAVSTTSLPSAAEESFGTISGATTLPPPVQGGHIDEVLADGAVTASELEQSYLLYIECLEAAGGHGKFAFDLSVGSGIAMEWSVKGDDAEGTKSDQLRSSCTARFLQGLEAAYDEDHPMGAAENEKIRQRILSCLTAAFPDRTRNLGPDSTAEEIYAVAEEIQSNRTEGGSDAVVVYDCDQSSRVGEWRPFGSP